MSNNGKSSTPRASATEINYLSRDLLLAGDATARSALAKALEVKVENIHSFDDIRDFAWLTNQLNTICYGAIGGDFSFKLDVHVFDITFERLEAKLLEFSTNDYTVAMADDSSLSPFHYTLYDRGKRRTVVIVESEDSSIFTLSRNVGERW